MPRTTEKFGREVDKPKRPTLRALIVTLGRLYYGLCIR